MLWIKATKTFNLLSSSYMLIMINKSCIFFLEIIFLVFLLLRMLYWKS